MKRYMITSLSLLFAAGLYAQKSEIKSMKKILNKKTPTEVDYKELQGIIDATLPYIANGTVEEQAEFYYLKGQYEYEKVKKTGNIEALDNAVSSFNKLMKIEENEKKKIFTEKLKQGEMLSGLKSIAFKKAVDFSKNKKYREASDVFKSIYDMDKDPLYLYYAASSSINVPDYNTALEYYQILLDMNFTGVFDYYTAVNKETGEVENFGDSKGLMDELVKVGKYTNPKKETQKSKKPEIYKNMVLIYMNVNQNARAEKLLVDARKESPDDMDLLLIQANFFLQNKETEKFNALMKEAISKNPNNPELYFNLGVTSAEAGNVVKAEEYYKKALQIDAKHVNSYINLGALVLKEEEAIIEKMNAITGFTAADNKKYEELKKQRQTVLQRAALHFERVLVIEPDNQLALSNLASIYGALDMPEKEKQYKDRIRN